MIDSHCHLEQQDYNKDRDKIIEKCRKAGLKAIVTCCARPRDFDLTMQMVEKHRGFIFATAGIHPEFIKEISEKEIDEFIETIRKNRDKIVAVGEVGLDYNWVKEKEWQEKQKELFIKFIALAKELNKPLVIHARDAFDEAVKILEEQGLSGGIGTAGQNPQEFQLPAVLMHMFGANNLVKEIIKNNWFVSINTILLKSKKHKKVIRDVPLSHILLETDAPWLGPNGERNDPTSIKLVAEKIAEVKKLDFETVWKTCGENAGSFFGI